MPQVPPARPADDEIHLVQKSARSLSPDEFPAQCHAHGASLGWKNTVIRSADVIAVLPHGRQILVVAIVPAIRENKQETVEAIFPRLRDERPADDTTVLACEFSQQLQ